MTPQTFTFASSPLVESPLTKSLDFFPFSFTHGLHLAYGNDSRLHTESRSSSGRWSCWVAAP
jgi:hypothetical protein